MLEVEGEIIEARLGGPAFLLRRRIEAEAGGAVLRVRDVVENIGPSPAPHAVLYHLNLGWPLLAPDSLVTLDGAPLGAPLAPGDPAARPAVTCHGTTTGVARVASPEGVALTLRFDVATLPFLQLWHDLRPGVAVLGLEPCSTDRGAALPWLAPGDTRRDALDIAWDDGAGAATETQS